MVFYVRDLNRNRVHSSKLASLVILAIYQAPKREAFVCRDAPSRSLRDRRSRQLAAGWQTKGADSHLYAIMLLNAVRFGHC